MLSPWVSMLLLILVVMVGACLYLISRRPDNQNEAHILRERLAGKQAELESLKTNLADINQRLEDARAENVSLREQLSGLQTRLEQDRKSSQEKIQLLQSAREQMALEFKNLANDILEQKGKTFSDTSRKNIQDILKPLSERIQQFEKKVEETYNRESNERFSLAKEIKTLQELNTRISEDAINLTNALKGESKTQGTWGEVILERVLEKSGLTRGREYEVQVSQRTAEGGTRQPDVIVRLPEGKDVIIDSKVSLSAYERYASADDEKDRDIHVKQHIQSLRAHIKSLSAKDYHNLKEIRSLDFVMMFLPVEAAFSLAVQHDSNLFMEAFEKNIILVGPSTLLATLKTIQNIWRYEYQNKNAQDIAERAGALYDKFYGFITDLEDIGKKLNQTRDVYDSAHNKLTSGRGNLVGQVEKLRVLGARTNKQLPGRITDTDEPEPDEEDDENAELPASREHTAE